MAVGQSDLLLRVFYGGAVAEGGTMLPQERTHRDKSRLHRLSTPKTNLVLTYGRVASNHNR